MLYQAQFTRMGYGFARMMPDDDSVSIQNAAFEKTFGEAGNTVVVAMEDPNFFTVEHIAEWQVYTDSLNQIKGVENILSITNSFELVVDSVNQTLLVEPLLASTPTTEAEVAEFKAHVMKLPFYKNLLYTEDGNVIMMLIRIEHDALFNKQIIEIVENIKSINANFEKQNGLKVHTSGLPYIRMANTIKLKNEVYMLIAFTVLVTALLLFAFLRSVRAMLISLLVVLLGVVCTFGLLGALGYEISMLSSLIPPLVIVIGVPNCIYLINKYHQEYREHNNKIKALQRVIRKIGTVTVMTNFTTAMGFATFILTDSQALVEFGIISSIIVLLVFMLSIILIPIIYSYLKPPKERHYKHFDQKWMQGMIRFIISASTHHRPAVYISTIIIVAIGVFGIFQIRVTGNLTGDLEHHDPVYQDIKFLEEKFHGVVPLEIVVDTQKKNGVNKLSTLKKIDKFQQRVAELPQVSRSLSIVDFLKFARQGILFGNPDMYALPSRQEQQWMLKYLPKENKKADMIGTLVDSTGQKARISMQMADLGTSEMRDLQNQITAIASEEFSADNYKLTVTGASVKFLRTTDYLIKNLMMSMILAIAVISILMAFLFGSWRMVLISMVPNIIPLLLTAGLMGFVGIPLKPSTILIFSIALGISVDDTIHYLARYRQEVRSNGWRIADAVTNAINETAPSMFYTSIVLFFGFSVFMLSSFGGTMAVGFLIAITLLFALITNLILLPSLLMTLDRLIRARDFSENGIEIFDEVVDEDLDDLKDLEDEIDSPK